MPDGAIRERRYDRKIARVEQKLGEPLVPTSQREQIYRMSPRELKTYFPARWEVFEKLLKEKGETVTKEHLFAFAQWIRTLNSLDDYIESHEKDESGRVLRHYQAETFRDLRMYIELGHKRGYVELPGGSGKTVIFSEFIKATGLRTLVVTPFKHLVEQTQKEIQRFTGKEVGMIYADQKDYGSSIAVVTYWSFLEGVRSGKIDPKQYDCLIVDEADTAMSDKAVTTIDQFSHALILGFTATPKRSEEKHISTIYENEIHAITIREAVEFGAMAPFHVIPVHTHCDASKIRIKPDGNYDQEDVDRVLNIKKRNKAFAQLYKDAHWGVKGIAYLPGVASAEAFVEECKTIGIPADKVAAVTYKTEKNERQRVIQAFHEGSIWLLATVRALGRGFNDEHVSVIFRMNPTQSIADCTQEAERGGRVPQKEYEGREMKRDGMKVGFRRGFDKVNMVYEAQDDYTDDRFRPVSFMEVAQGSVVYPLTSPDEHESFRYPPIKHQEIEIEGIDVTYDSVIAFRMHEEMERKKYASVPAGWLTLQEVAELFGMSKLVTRMRLKKGTLQGSAVKEKFINSKTRRLSDYYDNTENKLFTLLASEKELLRRGWRLNTDVAKDLGFEENPEVLLDSYQRIEWDHPNWVIKRIDESGTYKQYLAPELLEMAFKIRKGKPPKDWFEDSTLAPEDKTLPVRAGRTLSIRGGKVPYFLRAHPEYIRWYRTEDGFKQHFHPLVAELWNTDKIDPNYDKQYPIVPSTGWMMVRWIKADITQNERTAIRDFRIKEGWNIQEYVPQEVGVAIKRRLRSNVRVSLLENQDKELIPHHELQNVPREELLRLGWKSASAFLRVFEYKKDPEALSHHFEWLEADHPDWVIRRYKNGEYQEYLHPKLIELTLKIWPGNPPQGWFVHPTTPGVTKAHPIKDKEGMDRFGFRTPLYLRAHPENKRWYHSKGSDDPLCEYFAPELLDVWNTDEKDSTSKTHYASLRSGFTSVDLLIEELNFNDDFFDKVLTHKERISSRYFYDPVTKSGKEYIPDIVADAVRARRLGGKRDTQTKSELSFDPQTAPREELLKRGWQDVNHLVETFGWSADPEVISEHFRWHEVQHPEWVIRRYEDYEDELYSEYLSPELVKIAFDIHEGPPDPDWFEHPETYEGETPHSIHVSEAMNIYGENTAVNLRALSVPGLIRWHYLNEEKHPRQFFDPRIKEKWNNDEIDISGRVAYPDPIRGFVKLAPFFEETEKTRDSFLKRWITERERVSIRSFYSPYNKVGEKYHFEEYIPEIVAQKIRERMNNIDRIMKKRGKK